MKKLVCLVSVAGVLMAGCGNNSVVNQEKVDKLGKKFDSAAEKLWDSTKAEGKQVGKELKNRIDSVKLR